MIVPPLVVLTDQVTPRFCESLATVAVNLKLSPVPKVALEGLMVMVMPEVMASVVLPEACASATDVAVIVIVGGELGLGTMDGAV